MPSELSSQLLSPTPRPDIVMSRGQGSWIWDESGRRYLDFVQGWAVCCLGHSPAVIRDALSKQAETLITPSPAYHNRPQLELASALCRASGLDRVFFCSNGAEANETAIKLARKWGSTRRDGAHQIVTLSGAFHGRTLVTMAATDKPRWSTLFGPAAPGFVRVEFGDLDAIEAVLDATTAAVMLEPIQGEAGVVVPPPGYIEAVRDLTRERGILLILDEIQTGMGRTGPLFAHQHWHITPDIMTLGKGIGGGVPLAAVLAGDDIACFEPGDIGGTYNGNPLMASVGLAVLAELTSREFRTNAETVARHLRASLEELAAQMSGSHVRGMGHLLALSLPEEIAASVAAECLEKGLLINTPRPNLLRFMPALNLTIEEVDVMIEILRGVLEHRFAGSFAAQ